LCCGGVNTTSAMDEADTMGDPGCAGDDGSTVDAAGEALIGERPVEAVEDSAETMNDACTLRHLW